jgi:hypothetical protein
MRLPRRLGMMMTGLAGIFGIRTPPPPQVIAQTQPARPARGPAGDDPAEPDEPRFEPLLRGPVRGPEDR